VTKTDSADPVLVGNPLTYTITAINSGPDAATGVVLTDALPADVIYGFAVPSQGTGCAEAGGSVTCDLGDLVSGASATVTLVVTPTVEGSITNTAGVTSGVFDPQSGNNTATEGTVVLTGIVPPGELTLTGPTTGVVGQASFFTATVTPPIATLPITYTWEAAEQGVITRPGGLADTVDLTWTMVGTKAITVTAHNVAGSTTATHTVTIKSFVYLPLVLRNYQ